MSYHIGEIRRFIAERFDDEEVKLLCFDYFSEVYSDFTAGMTKTQMIMQLVEFCLHRDIMDELLQRIHNERPKQFKERFPEFSTSINNELQNPSSNLSEISGRLGSEEVVKACRTALVELLSLQYPWGEWSDRRTALESIIAEREPFRGPEGPKPNVARTLFALEVLNYFKGSFLDRQARLGLTWMTQAVSEGWYWEWTSTQSLDSESSVPNLVPRRDVRHSAQVTSALCRWATKRDPLASLLNNLATSCVLNNGFCPDTPGESAPRLLASVYVVEALGYSVSGRFRLSLDDLIDNRSVIDVKSSLRRGLNALHRECDYGDGLIGHSFSGPTPYLTGIALFRLASLSSTNHDFRELTEKMVAGLIATAESSGWVDYSVKSPTRSKTRKRTTLRVAAGLGLASREGVVIPKNIIGLALDQACEFVLDEDEMDLDSPDFACALLCIFSFLEEVKESIDLQSLEADVQENRRKYLPVWLKNYERHASHLSDGREMGIDTYEILMHSFEECIKLLQNISQ